MRDNMIIRVKRVYSRILRGFFLSFLVIVGTASKVNSEIGSISSLSGAYLVAQQAGIRHDHKIAFQSYTRIYDANPDNRAFSSRLLFLQVINGHIESAEQLAQHIVHSESRHYMSRLILAVFAARGHHYASALNHLQRIESSDPFILFSLDLVKAWIYLASRDETRALSHLDAFRNKEEFRPYYAYNAALISELLGKKAEADRFFSSADIFGANLLRILETYGYFLLRTGENQRVEDFLTQLRDSSGTGVLIKDIEDRLRSGRIPLLAVDSVDAGLAEALYMLGTMVASGSKELAVVYFRLALYLKKDLPFALVGLAHIYDTWDQRDIALSLYESVQEGLAVGVLADIRRAVDYNLLGDVEKAASIIRNLVNNYPEEFEAMTLLGDIYMGRNRFDEAIQAYSFVLDRLVSLNQKYASLLYVRATAHDRSGNLTLAEKDLKQAIQIAPDNPTLLNYLAYSWVERKMNLEEALVMLKKAVSLAVNDGAIVDSLGWCYYKMGHHDSAILWLERGIELSPTDPVVNEHLGDAYWQAGRYLEARYQWRHALRFSPPSRDTDELKLKIKQGMKEKAQQKSKSL